MPNPLDAEPGRALRNSDAGCPTLRGFRSVGIPTAVTGRFSRLHPFAAAFLTGRMGSPEVFHRSISPQCSRNRDRDFHSFHTARV